jgi:hypothetical protein
VEPAVSPPTIAAIVEAVHGIDTDDFPLQGQEVLAANLEDVDDDVEDELDPALGHAEELPFVSQNDDESDDSDIDGDLEQLASTNRYVGDDMSPDEDIGFSVYEFDDTGIGLANATVTIDVDNKKSKKRSTKEKDPPPPMPPERSYSKYNQGDPGIHAKNDFKRNAHGTAGSNLKAFDGKDPGQCVVMMWQDCMLHLVYCFNVRKDVDPAMAKVAPLTIGKMKIYFGIRQYIALFKRPNERAFFETHRCGSRLNDMANLCKYMSWKDYTDIKRFLRCEVYHIKTEEEKSYKAWKVKTIFDIVKRKCVEFMPAPGEQISIDEAMFRAFMRCPIRVSMPAKPISKGILAYCAVDYATKWVFNIDLCDGMFTANDFEDVPWGLTGHRVLRLLKHLPGEWYIIYTDNFYTSEGLAMELLRLKKYLIGTLRKNRLPQGRPDGFLSKTKKPKPTRACPKGTISSIVNTTQTVAVHSMMDSSMVYILDSAIGPQTLTDMVRKQKSGEKVSLQVYDAIVKYNQYMGGVDAMDQMRVGYYGVDMGTRNMKWTTRFLDAMFNFSATQAWVAYRYNNAKCKNSRFRFTVDFCHALLDNTDDQVVPRITRRMTKQAEASEIIPGAFGVHHHNIALPPDHNSSKTDGYNRTTLKKCVLCDSRKSFKGDKRTTTCCFECNMLPLHSKCMADYHNQFFDEDDLP